jgi:TolA-binding protein
LSVSADEYRELKIAKDTAMMRAGELAHQLAQAQGDVDDLQERLELTSQRLQAASVESVELKSRNDDLQSKVQWLEKQVQELKGRSSSNHGKGGVPRTPSSRLGQFLTRSSATKPSSIIPPSPLYRLSILTGSSPTSSSEPSLGTLPLTSRADDAVLDSPSETCERLAKPADCVGAADAATSEAVMEGIEDANTAMAAALLQLTQRVQRLEKEKAECLAALVESQNQVEFLLQRHPPHTSSSLESKDVPSNPTT